MNMRTKKTNINRSIDVCKFWGLNDRVDVQRARRSMAKLRLFVAPLYTDSTEYWVLDTFLSTCRFGHGSFYVSMYDFNFDLRVRQFFSS